MANKFLGALGLDVLVNKIKDVIAKLDTKQDQLNCAVFDLATTNPQISAVIAVTILHQATILRHCVQTANGNLKKVAEDVSTLIRVPLHTNQVNIAKITELINSDNGTIVNIFSSENTVVYYGNQLCRITADGDYEPIDISSGAAVEEITADEVTEKFNS